MLIFKNVENGKSFEIEAYKVGDFEGLRKEVDKFMPPKKDFQIFCYNEKGVPVKVENDRSFQEIRDKELGFYIFELGPESAVGELKAKAEAEVRAEALKEFPHLTDGNSPRVSAISEILPTEEFRLCDSKLGRTSFGAISQIDFNNLFRENKTIVDLNDSIRELESDMVSGLAELKASLSKTGPVAADSKKETFLEVHKGVVCDVCKKTPIRGKRFKCLVCRDWDMCMACEKTNSHVHPLLRLSERPDANALEEAKKAAQFKTQFDKMSEDQRRKTLLKFFAGSAYLEPFYNQIIEKNRDVEFSAFVHKIAHIFS